MVRGGKGLWGGEVARGGEGWLSARLRRLVRVVRVVRVLRVVRGGSA